MKKVVVIISALFLMLSSCKTKQNDLGDFAIEVNHVVRGDSTTILDTLKTDTLKHKCCTKK
jgi:hypothetical protein